MDAFQTDICTKFFCLQKTKNRTTVPRQMLSAATLPLSNVYERRDSAVIVTKKSQLVLGIKSTTKRIFRNFHILKINRITLFCNLFTERHSYLRHLINRRARAMTQHIATSGSVVKKTVRKCLQLFLADR